MFIHEIKNKTNQYLPIDSSTNHTNFYQQTQVWDRLMFTYRRKYKTNQCLLIDSSRQTFIYRQGKVSN